ncbi:Hypothetical predicted protein [Paramuricea clavata]|uniref:Uncharacterized protein n=1 Tax=Paramuricea clavata TaxID=317549 RepID=A0A6S7L0R3_PARCT|nr:Hypothetical predicted protein [Paramuricea clavata]
MEAKGLTMDFDWKCADLKEDEEQMGKGHSEKEHSEKVHSEKEHSEKNIERKSIRKNNIQGMNIRKKNIWEKNINRWNAAGTRSRTKLLSCQL